MWLALVVFALVGCEPATSSPQPVDTPTISSEPEAGVAHSLRVAAVRIDWAPLAASLLAGVGSGTRPETPPASNLAQALEAVDWPALVEGTDGQIGARLHQALRATLRDGQGPSSGSGTTVMSVSSGQRLALNAPLIRPLPVGNTAHAVSSGGGSETSGDVETSVDEESSEETTTFSINSTGTDSVTGDDVAVHIEGQRTRDLCWAEDGSRQSSTTTATTVTRQTEGGPVATTIATTTTVTVDPMGAVTSSSSVTQDGYTATSTISTNDLPQDESVTESSAGNRSTGTYTDEQGHTFTVEWEGDFNQEKFDAVIDTFTEMGSDFADAVADEVASLQKPLNDSSPGGNEYCIHLKLDPTSAQIGPDGDTVVIAAAVTDWADRPLAAAVMKVTEARLGSVAPTVGSTTGTGEWQTTYTSAKPGVERLTLLAARFGFGVERQVTITISSGTALHWSDSKFGQTASFAAVSCDDTTWTGTFSFSGSPGGASLAMATELRFETVDGHGETEIVNTGTIGAGGEELSIQMPYSVTVDIDDQTGTAHVSMTRQSNTVTVEGFTISAAAFPEFTFDAPLTATTECP